MPDLRPLLIAVLSLCSTLCVQNNLSAQDNALELTNVSTSAPAYVRVAQSQDLELQEFTLEAWIMPIGPGASAGGPGTRQIAGIPQEGVTGHWLAPYGLFWNSSSSVVTGYISTATGSGAVAHGVVSIPAGTSVHVAMSFSGETVKLYLNGRFQSESTASAPGITYYGDDFTIGASNFGADYGRRFDGHIDEVRLWDHVRTEEEIAALMNCSLSGSEVGLVASWDFTGGSLADQSGNGHDGIAEGSGVSMAEGLVDYDYCGLEYVTFSRADCNVDGAFNLADAVFVLGVLFTGEGPVVCEDACDANDDGSLNISDAIWKLNALFLTGSATPPEPFSNCGVDPTADMLTCSPSLVCP